MSLTEEERIDIVKYRIEKAEITFSHIQINIEAGYWEIVANRLYYAAYYMVSALLIKTSLKQRAMMVLSAFSDNISLPPRK